MKFPNGIVLVVVFCSVIVSCKKKNNAPPPPTKTEHLTRSSWQFEKATASGIDVTAMVPACFKDNIITFASNGTGTISEGTIGCVPPAPSVFTWSFQNNETQLSLSAAIITGGSGLFNIITLNETNLVISQDITLPPNPTTNVVLTFKH